MEKRIHRFKFANNAVDRVYFTGLFHSMKEEKTPLGDMIVYPPVRWFDFLFRGPNHAKRLAGYFSEGLSIPLLCPFTKKFTAGHQSRRRKQERQKASEEYLLKSKLVNEVVGKRIILVDDLITTGYTAHTLGKLLLDAGASEVVGYFLASEKV